MIAKIFFLFLSGKNKHFNFQNLTSDLNAIAGQYRIRMYVILTFFQNAGQMMSMTQIFFSSVNGKMSLKKYSQYH